MHNYPLLLCSLIAAVLIASCGGGSTSGVTPAAAPPAQPATSAAAPAPTSLQPTDATALPGDPATQIPNAAPAASLANVQIALKLISDQVDQPVYMTYVAADSSNRLFVVEKRGRVVALQAGNPSPTIFLDISNRVGSSGSEQGLLSVAFHPQFTQNGQLFVNYTDLNGDTVVSRFQASGERADPDSEMMLLAIDQPYPNHNGGLVLFGPDGYLYVGMGDGGSGGDPQGNGQDRSALLGKLLRLDVDGAEPYAIPPDNPWPDGGDGRPEVWAYGLRNPWRFSFDRATNDLYIADVGQGDYEEINMQPAGSGGGANYGWNITEGQHCFRGNSCDDSGLVVPVAEYDHSQGCSITGGYVYRGAALPGLQGAYIYGDYCSGRIWRMRQDGAGQWQQRELLQEDLNISSFGEDQAGEIYLTDLSGALYQVVGG
jgi:glucose/arabinose dehydrogenase